MTDDPLRAALVAALRLARRAALAASAPDEGPLMPAVVTFSRCWDDHEGPDGGHADGSECPDQLRPPRQGVDRAAVLALLRGEP